MSIPANYASSWLRWDLWEAVNGKCSNTQYTSQSTCVSHSKVWTPAAHNTWNGCVTDRDQNYDTTNDAPVAGSTLYPAEQYSSCPVSLVGLSNDWTALSNKINAMQPVGNTNQAIGLQMGWQSLTAAPFTIPAMDPNYQYNQVHHSAERRIEHRGPLVHQRLFDRRAATEDSATISRPPASRSTPCRSTPVTMRPQRC